ncbi:MAG: hypothetical protein A4S12_04780 [Proteobacteria bacterium SG_bin5]|nr:MAG: hypothetical protein A4S12_04780 [Proteobacteria bacterium SG_bin5]
MKALIFDLDGVVADSAAAHRRSWERLAAEEGVTFDPRALLGLTREDSLDVFLGARALDAGERADWLARKQAYFQDELAAMGPDDALPGVRALLAEAAAAGVPCALASSSRNARAVLDRLELRAAFAFVADGASVAHPKPAPDIFLLAARALGMAPADALVIEDAAAGAEAARAGGFGLVTVGPERRSPRHFTSLAGVTLAELRDGAG